MSSAIKIATWNLWWRFDEWQARQQPILDELRALDADIVTLQESWPAQVHALGESLGMFSTWAGRGPDPETDPDGIGFGNGILSRWPITAENHEMLADGEGRRYRSIVHALVDTPDRPLAVYTTHLEFRYAHTLVRQQQLQAALEFVGQSQPAGVVTVLTGDLNAVPDSDEIRRLTGRSVPYVDGTAWTDAWEVTQAASEAGETWSSQNPWLPNATWPNRRLDYVLVQWPRPDSPIGNPVQTRRFGMEPRGGVVPSDHFGVVADLRW